MKMFWIVLATWGLGCGIAGAATAADTYLPLEPGLRWIYGVPPDSYPDTVIVIGPAVFDGVSAVEFRYHGLDEGLSNFWTVAPDGAVLFHGFDIPAESFAIHYIPPIRMVLPPLLLGSSWHDIVKSRCVRRQICDTTGTYYQSIVNEVGPHTVPAGTFTAAAVELDVVSLLTAAGPGADGRSILGTKPPPGGSVTQSGALRWWAAGVGLIEDPYGRMLTTFDRVTPVRSATWGTIKSRYAGN